MTKKDRLIIQNREFIRTLSKEEYEHLISPEVQRTAWIDNLGIWSTDAANILKANGFKNVFNYGWGNKFAWHPQAIEDYPNNETQAADFLLRSIHGLYEATKTNNRDLIINRAIKVGMAVVEAHVVDFEDFAVAGKKSSEGHKNRTDQFRKESFQQWIKENPEKVKNCRTVNDLREIPRIKSIPVKDGTLKKWFKEIYPGQLQSGRPKKGS